MWDNTKFQKRKEELPLVNKGGAAEKKTTGCYSVVWGPTLRKTRKKEMLRRFQVGEAHLALRFNVKGPPPRKDQKHPGRAEHWVGCEKSQFRKKVR